MKKLRQTALAELAREAGRLKAHGVVSVRLTYSEIGTGKGMSMMLLVASGSAVRVKDPDGDS